MNTKLFKSAKPIKKVLILSVIITMAFVTTFTGCMDIYTMGTLELTNKSIGTVQRIMIDGVNYGSLDPSESKEISLAPGEHTFQQVGISGGSGCSEAKVIIVAGQTSGFSCSN